jgi:Fe-S oxidoreductase
MKHLEQFKDDIYTCVRTRCGFCIQECPTYRDGLIESFASRGKMLQAKGLLEGQFQLSQELADSVFFCTMCGYCEAKCALQNLEIFKALREELVDAGFTKKENDAVAKNIIEKGDPLGSGKQINVDGEVQLYLGCAYRDRQTDAERIVKVLGKLGLKVRITDEVCCANALYNTGYKKEFEQAKARFMEVYKPYLNDTIITVCPSCTLTLKEYFGLPKVVHATELILERLPNVTFKKATEKATYHDPCHLGRGLKNFDAPRQIIRMLGYELAEMRLNNNFSQCCGGGGGLQAHATETVKETAKRRVREAIDTGAQYISTICPTCESIFFRATMAVSREEKEKGTGKRMKSKDIWQMLEEALE